MSIKNIIVVVFGVVLVIAVGWFIRNDLNSGNQPVAVQPPSPSATTPSPEATSKPDGTASNGKPVDPRVAALKAEALSILNRTLDVKSSMSGEALTGTVGRIQSLISLIKSRFDYVDAWLDLGSYERVVGDNEGTILAWKFAAKLAPTSFIPPHNLGDIYAFTLRQYKEGEQYFLKSIELNSGNIQGYLALDTLYKIDQFGKKDQIEPTLLRGLKDNSKDLTLLTRLAGYYRDSNQVAKAITRYQEALKLNPPNRDLIEQELAFLEAKL